MAIQGIAQLHHKGELGNDRCSPNQLRDILRDPNTGTASNDPPNDRIGAMPDLKKIINKMLGIAILERITLPPEENLSIIKTLKRFRGPGPKKQALRKRQAKAKRKSPK